MKNDQSKNEKDLFAEALERKPEERAAFLDNACGSDQRLRNRIQRLLDAHEAADRFLEEPMDGISPAAMDRIGRFRILRELGRGGQGAVYLAEDEKLHRQVAIKVLPSGFDLAPHLLERFKREAEAASRLDHPGICSVFETGEAEGLHYIVMRYVEGESLASMIARAREDPFRFKGGVFEPSKSGKDSSGTGKDSSSTGSGTARQDAVMRSVHCTEKAALAVHAAHESGIIHRDLKPGNIMVTTDGEPVILDFGLARLEESDGAELTRSTDFLGTPAYMSPEQIRGDRKRIGRQTDIYSLAATLVECLTLRPPFEAPTREGLYRAILTEEPPDPRSANPRIPSDLGVILQTALAKNPDHRYKTALDFAEELRRARQHEPIRTRRAGPLLKLLRWSQRNPRLAAALGGIILVLVLGFAVSTYQLGKTRLALQENERNTDIWLLTFLEQQAQEDLWPALPRKVKDMNSWLVKAEKLYGRLDRYQHWLEMMRSDLATRPDQTLRDEVAQMAGFLDKLSRFEPVIDEVKERLNFAETVEDKTIHQHQEDWDATIEAIADRDKYPQYNGLRIAQMIGLIPLGQDPQSGFFEFAHLQTGKEPKRMEDGKLEITGETGLVLVLLPDDTFEMGVLPRSDENPVGAPYVDPDAERNEYPLHDVKLDSFLLSKYEMTQGQWFRVSGKNPSFNRPGSKHTGYDTGADLRYPVEMVSPKECDRIMARLCLVLPTEAQWEYACRAGTKTPWYTGSDSQSLQGFENIADRGSAKGLVKGSQIEKELFDRFMATAPVGTFDPNPFGFHDMLGNVSEWCCESLGSYYEDVVSGNGERLVHHYQWESKLRAYRGGNYRTAGRSARSARRDALLPDWRSDQNGLRPAMLIMKKRPEDAGEASIPKEKKETLKALWEEADELTFQKNYAEAETRYRHLLKDYIHYLGEGQRNTNRLRECLAFVLEKQNKYYGAETLYRRLLEDHIHNHGEAHRKTPILRDYLAGALYRQGNDSDAELLYCQVYESVVRLYGENHLGTLEVLEALSSAITRQGKYAQAESLFRQLYDKRSGQLSEEDQIVIKSRNELARVLLQVGKYEESELLFRQNMKFGESYNLEEKNGQIRIAANYLPTTLLRLGRLSEAKPLIENEIVIRKRIYGDDVKATLNSKSVLADVLLKQGNLTGAEELHRKILNTRKSLLGEDNPHTISSMRSLALVLVERGKLSDAEPLLRRAVRLVEDILPEESMDKLSYHMDYGRLLLALKQFDEAETQIADVFENYRALLREDHDFTQESLRTLIELYEAWGKPEMAAGYREKLINKAAPLTEDNS